jgi:prophage DNA circulation protein
MADLCRDWLKTLWPASYRGVPMQVEKDSGLYGKRVQVHEYPNRETWYPEEFGQRARIYRLTAYLASDTIDAELSALVEACTRPGSGTLVLPLDGAKRAINLKVQTDRRKDKHGYVAVDLEFVEDPGIGPAPYPTPYYAGLVGQAAVALTAAIEVSFAAAHLTSGAPDHVLDAAADEVAAIAVAIETERGSAQAESASAADVAQTLADLYTAAVPLSRGETVPIGAAVEVVSIPAAIAAAVTVFQTAAEPAAAPAALKRAAESLLESGTIEPDSGTTVRSTTDTADLQAALVRRTGIAIIAARLAVAIAERQFENRRAAIQARADIVSLFEPLIGASSRAEDVAALAAVRDAAVEYVSRTIADLAPVIEVSARQSMPSVWWAYRLYGDATRAEELAARNGASHPSFMPETIEALAR